MQALLVYLNLASLEHEEVSNIRSTQIVFATFTVQVFD